MNYITTIISSEYMQIGGFGHIFHDLLTSYIISHMVKNLKFVYYPISSLGDDHHKNLKHDDIFNKINWDSFLKFSENEIHFNDIKDKVNNIINIKLCDPFMTFTIDKFTEIIKNKTNTLFVITQNNRIHINEIYYTNNDIYNNEQFILWKKKWEHRSKLNNNSSEKSGSNPTRVSYILAAP